MQAQIESPGASTGITQILVVDDNSHTRRLLKLQLGGKYDVLEAIDGEQALKLLAQHQPKVILLDVMLPGTVNGLQVLDAVKRDTQRRDTLVGMVTGRSQLFDCSEANRLGADAYFIKPFSPSAVGAWVDKKLLCSA